MSSAYLIGVGVCGAVVPLALVWALAYRVGFREGRETVPLALLLAAAEHRTGCERVSAEQVVRELVDSLDLPEAESRRLVARARDGKRVRVAVSELRTAS